MKDFKGMEYLHRFNSVQEFQGAYYGEDYEQPWIGAVGSRDSAEPPVISYNKFNDNGHEWVDLGLPSGTLWATMNIGASSPEQVGMKVAWGEISSRASNTYNLANYKWGNVTGKTYQASAMTKYNQTDNLTYLEPDDDLAHVLWGGSWTTPSAYEISELLSCTTYSYESGGTSSYVYTSKINGNQLRFCPYEQMHWSNEIYSYNVCYNAQAFGISYRSDKTYRTINPWSRYSDLPVRPVILLPGLAR